MRSYEPADADVVLAINLESEPGVGSMDEVKLAFFAEHAAFFVVAEARDFAGDEGDDDETVLGFMVVLDESVEGYGSNNYAWFKERYPSFAYVDRIAVTASAKGRGLGPAMYRAVEAWAVGHGKPHLVAEVNTIPDNPHSHHFHLKSGFTEVGRGHPYGGDEEVAYYERLL